MNFLVRADNRLRNVRVAFATGADLSLLKRWRRPAGSPANPHARDAVTFSKLACKWWQYYLRQNSTATSLHQLKSFVSDHPKDEVAFLVLAQAEWHEGSPVLGFCCCRRTWCNHIVLEFAAVNPAILSAECRKVYGVGTGMLQSLIEIADELGVKTIWGETTQYSAPFYEKVLGLPEVRDHFFISGPTMTHCRRRLGVLKGAVGCVKVLNGRTEYATVSYNEARGAYEKNGRVMGAGVPVPILGRKSA